MNEGFEYYDTVGDYDIYHNNRNGKYYLTLTNEDRILSVNFGNLTEAISYCQENSDDE